MSPNYGGPVNVCKNSCSALAKTGVEVTIYTTNLDYPRGILNVPLSTEIKENGYTIKYFPVQFMPYVYSFQLFRSIKNNIKNFDIVHIHGLYRFPQFVASYYARKYQIPYIVRPHGSLDPFLYNHKRNRIGKRIYEFLIENKNLNCASALHFTTEKEMQLVKPLGLEAPGFIIPNGLDLDKFSSVYTVGNFRKKYKIGNKKIILHFGRINFVKGLDILIDSFIKVSQVIDDVCLVIAGPDNDGYQSVVEKWIDVGGITSKVIFTGMLNGDEAWNLLTDSDIFVLPSYSESFGIAVFEAMYFELPVIISNKVKIYQEIQTANAGIVTSCNSIEVADAMIDLLNNNEECKAMGVAGKNLVKDKYNWKELANKLESKYQKIIATYPNYN